MREPVPSDLTAGDAEDPRTLQRYDALGRVTSRTDEVGRVTRYEYAVTGQLVAVVDAAGGRTELTYDQRGTRGASVATVASTYDSNDRLERELAARGALVTYAYDVTAV